MVVGAVPQSCDLLLESPSESCEETPSPYQTSDLKISL